MSSRAKPILSSEVTLEKRTLWFGTITLHEDHLTISGWGWTGPFEKQIPIESIHLIERWTNQRGPNYIMHLHNEPALHCRITRGAFYWEKEFSERDNIDLERRH